MFDLQNLILPLLTRSLTKMLYKGWRQD
jgi:hypothetical protein